MLKGYLMLQMVLTLRRLGDGVIDLNMIMITSINKEASYGYY
jgi:hypothetical protein